MPNLNLSPKAITQCSEAVYWKLLDRQCALVLDPEPVQKQHALERAFVDYGLLATSVLGGLCWPAAIRLICKQTIADLSTLFTAPAEAHLTVIRQGAPYPITVAPIVQYAGLLLIAQRLAHVPIQNNSLRCLPSNTELAPRPTTNAQMAVTAYRITLLQNHLSELCQMLKITPVPTLEQYVNTGRFLLKLHVYDIEIVHIVLGTLKTGTPLPAQRQTLLANLTQHSAAHYWQLSRPIHK